MLYQHKKIIAECEFIHRIHSIQSFIWFDHYDDEGTKFIDSDEFNFDDDADDSEASDEDDDVETFDDSDSTNKWFTFVVVGWFTGIEIGDDFTMWFSEW
jgi:hypothetical protein